MLEETVVVCSWNLYWIEFGHLLLDLGISVVGVGQPTVFRDLLHVQPEREEQTA